MAKRKPSQSRGRSRQQLWTPEELEQRVAQRTHELTTANQELKRKGAEQAQAEAELRQHKEFNEGIIQSMTEGVIVQDAEGNLTYANPAAATLLGYSLPELVGLPWTAIVPPDQHPLVQAADERRARGESDRYELQALHKNGQRIPILVSGSPRFGPEDGHLAGMLSVFTDISELVRTEEALRESEERFRTLFQGIPVCCWTFDQDGTILDWNLACEALYGWTAEEAVGKTMYDLMVQDENAPATREKVMGVFQGHSYHGLEYDDRRADGTTCTVLVYQYPLKDAEGRVIMGICAQLDITERKRAQVERERLLAAEREQRLLAETLREVTLMLTSQTSHAAVLDEILHQAQRVVPHSASDISLLQDDVLRIVRWQGYEEFGSESFLSGATQSLADFPLEAEVVQSRTPLVIADTRLEPRWMVLDETSWIRAHIGMPICLRDRVLGLLRLNADTPGEFSAQDVKRLQPLVNAAAIAIENARLVEGLEAEVAARTADIRAEQEKSETILRNVGDAIGMADLDRRIQYVNAAFTRLTGYTAEEVVGRHPNFLLAERMPEPDWQSLLVALAQGEEWQGEITIRRQDGRSYDAAVTTAPVRDATGQLVGYVSSHEDISQRKQLDRARRRFMTNVSHELRTPVTNIKLYASLLKKGISPEKTDRYLGVLDEQADRLSHLVQDILEMTALDGGRAGAAWEAVDPADLIRAVVARYSSRAQAAGLSLVARPVPAGLPAVKGDQSRLFQALEEIVENAIRFAPADGQVELEAGSILDQAPGDQQHWVTISVHDTGPGISPEEQERVFDRFFRGSLAESGHIPGTGLGLSIAQEIMQAHGGRVTVESRCVPGQGCTFTLWLPSAPENRPDGE